MRLQNKIALIMGGGGAMGTAIAKRFTGEGAVIVISDIFPEKAIALVEELRAAGVQAEFMQCNGTVEEEMQAMIASIAGKYGRLDIAVNAFGGGGASPRIVDTTKEQFAKIINNNLTSFFYAMKAEAAQMMKNGGGAIVSISSINSFVPTPRLGIYCAAKAGCDLLTKTLAMEVGPAGVRVNNINPGFTDTAGTRFFLDNKEVCAEVLYKTPTRRINTAEDIAAAALFLCSEDAANITATCLVLDGGESTEGYPDAFEILDGMPRTVSVE